MKTTRNLNQIAKVTLATASFLLVSLMPMQAAAGKNASSEMNEIQAASNSLAMYNTEVEKTVAFNAPVLSENSAEFEVFVAESRLNDLFSFASEDAKYVSPAVNEDFEVAASLQTLDQLYAQIEQTVKYTASIAE
jgi:hypothetical protein